MVFIGEKIGQGKENAKEFLRNHPEIYEEIDKKVRTHYGLIEEEKNKTKKDK